MIAQRVFFTLITFLFFNSLYAQDLLSELESSAESTTDYTFATFKSTRIVNAHSVDIEPEGELQFLISHRFGMLNSGGQQFWGLDQANIRLGLEYGVNNRWAVGLGRSSVNGGIDAYHKVKLLRQRSGKKNTPLSIVFLQGLVVGTRDFASADQSAYEFKHRVAYSHQLLIARKFNDKFSLQVMPSWLHQNLVRTRDDENDIFALGAAFRYKITNRFTVTGEYFYINGDPIVSTEIYNPLSIGLEIETGGHVFQLHLSNSRGMTAYQYLPNTVGTWGEGNIHFGFNVSRVFTLKE